ncbi:MAG: hypothetical protein M8357_12075 [Desulfobulbaceae bacterium]|nr:hypothetical protein [Desulfobulbaceae bacterium]
MRGPIFFIIFLLLSAAGPVCAQGPPAGNPSSYNQLILNGEVIAGEISRATGFAISPILGISVLGAYSYYTTPIEQRGGLPWHASPKFWGPLLAVLLGIILKDSSKIALPKILIMPLDAVETLLEKNTSAVLGLLVILSSVTGRGIEQMRLAGHDPQVAFIASAHAAEGVAGTAAALPSGGFELVILAIIVTIVFGLVWVVSQSFNFLIFLCPFSWLDLLLTMGKNAIIALLLGAYFIHPFLGLFGSSIIILICLFLFAGSYRFVIFGTIFSLDILLKSAGKDAVKSGPVKAFAGAAVGGVPSLSYGFLTRQDSRLVFHYRPWIFMPLKTVPTPFSCDQCDVGIGALSPVIVTTGKKMNSDLTLFRLRPLYKSHEQRIVELLGLRGIRDVTFGRTIRDGYRWLREQIGLFAKT